MYFEISVHFLFNMDPGPRAFFNAESPVRLQVGLAMDTPNVLYAHDIAVVRVEFRKMISWPYHEFIVFHVEEQAPRCAKTIIIVERYVSPRAISERGNEDSPNEHELVVVDDNWLNPQSQDSTSDIQTHDTKLHPQHQYYHSRCKPTSPKSLIATSSQAISFSSAIIASFIPEKPSSDLFTFVNLPNNYLDTLGQNDLCKTFSIPKNTFSVSQLAVLANVVHKHHQGYHLLEYQCYWFGAIIYDMILRMCQRKCLVEDVETPAANRLGKFGRIHVKLGRRNTTAEVLERYEEEWKVAHKKIIECRKVSFDIVLMTPRLK